MVGEKYFTKIIRCIGQLKIYFTLKYLLRLYHAFIHAGHLVNYYCVRITVLEPMSQVRVQLCMSRNSPTCENHVFCLKLVDLVGP